MENKHIGSSFDDFLKSEGIYEEVNKKSLIRVLKLLGNHHADVYARKYYKELAVELENNS